MKLRQKIGLVTALLVFISGLQVYATLGEGRRKSAKRKTELRLSNRMESTPGTLSLKSGYQYRGSKVLGEEKTSIRVNTVVALQKGKQVFNMPLKKEIWVDKIKISLGNQSLRRQ